MGAIWAIFKRELGGYFATPIAYVFLIIFVLLSGVFTFYLGNFLQLGQADLQSFFLFHPWLYLFLMPALAMRLWAEERRGGTIELLLTLPVTMYQAVLGKFFAAWTVGVAALAMTAPLWLTVNYLGDPDNGVILAAYLGSALMGGAFLAIGACFSALSKNQVIAFVLSAAACLGFVLSGFPLVLEFFAAWAPAFVVEAVSALSFLTHVDAISRGVIDLRDIVYFVSMIAFWLYATAVVIDMKKAR